MALRSHLIKDPHEVLRIIDNMSDSEPESESDDDTAISPELSDVETMESVRDDDTDNYYTKVPMIEEFFKQKVTDAQV